MNNNLIIKQYDVDYSFIIKNYLDESLWNKKWTLFVYKNYTFYLELHEIQVKNKRICFKISFNDLTYFIYYNKEISNINILKKQINGAIFSLIEMYEHTLIRKEKEYQKIEDGKDEEIDLLTEIAEEFLDENNVSNDEIRQAYINKYVDDNTKTDDYLLEYINIRKYKILTDLYLVYTKASGDNDRYNNINKITKEEPNYNELMEEVNEYLEKLENDKEDLEVEFKECLEAI